LDRAQEIVVRAQICAVEQRDKRFVVSVPMNTDLRKPSMNGRRHPVKKITRRRSDSNAHAEHQSEGDVKTEELEPYFDIEALWLRTWHYEKEEPNCG